MELRNAKAKPIEIEGRNLILIFGPDKELKRIAAAARSQFNGYTINIRSTDNPPDAYAEGTPCEMRIIIDNQNGRQIARLYQAVNFPVRMMRWDGERLSDVNASAPVLEVPASSGEDVVLSNGTRVPRDVALELGARAMNMSPAAFSALDEGTISASVELAMDAAPKPAAKRRGRPPKIRDTQEI